MQIVLAQQNYHIGNFESNTNKIISAIKRAKEIQADLIVFSELAICGYPPRDFLYFEDFIHQCNLSIKKIKNESDNIAVLIGAPQKNTNSKGKTLYNSVYFIENKIIKQIINKTCLPTYDVFDEDRYFEPASEWNIVECKGNKIAVTICEDIWNMGNHPLYSTCPMDMLLKYNPALMINLSASPFDYNHEEDRKSIIKANVLKYKIPMLYCNTVGSQTEIVFDGTSLAFDKDANLIGQLSSFKEDFQSFTFNDKGNIEGEIIEKSTTISSKETISNKLQPAFNIDLIYQTIVLGIKDYFLKMGFNKAIIGSSGGIDSAVTIALAVEALGKENVIALLMPSSFSSNHSVEDAVELSKKLQNPYHILPINSIYESFINELQPIFNSLPFNIAEENIQSRTRGNLLMAVANKFGYILLNTSNKSELATGYGTLYGDMAGGISVLGDCYKLQVYELAKYINMKNEIIPSNIINKPPSAELRPNQKDSDSLPEYSILDNILFQYIEQTKGPDEIKSMGYENDLVNQVLKMVNANEYKRNQFCPIIRISSKAFGVGRRMPIVGKYL